MMTTILTWLLGGGLSALTGALNDAYKAKLAAENDAAKLAADQAIAFYQGQIALAQTAAQSDRWWSPRELMGICVAAYVGKIVLWDTVLQLGTTPDPGSQVTGIVMVVVGFYFGSKAIGDIAARLLAR